MPRAEHDSRARFTSKSGTLYVVATPLGNLEDITLRALRVLKEVDLIAAEDTRHSRKLLAQHGIGTPLTSYHDYIERQKAPQLIGELKRGKSIALISDAGTPCIADPGYHLVRAAIEADIRVEAVPGPSAVAAALSIAGLPTDRFAFEGFVPARRSARRKFFEALAHEPRTLLMYEAARRLASCLRDLHEVMGDRRVVIVRELTKMFEEVIRGPIGEISQRLSDQPLQGEVTLLIAGQRQQPHRPHRAKTSAPPSSDCAAKACASKEIARILARQRRLSRREVYQAGLALGHPDDG